MNGATCLMDIDLEIEALSRSGDSVKIPKPPSDDHTRQVFVCKFSYNESSLGSSNGKYASVSDDATVG
jgi:hypothetical protein